jgi:cyclophilin family peptidyl-prolyl cis-trans isomerase
MASQQSNTRRTGMRVAAAIVLVIVGVLLYQRLWGDGDDDDRTSADLSDQTPGVGDEEDEVTTTLADPGTPVEPTCPAADGSSPREVNFSGPPPMCIDPVLTYVATVETTRGDFEITLDTQAAPLAANNFVFLARWHYYDGVGFHRIIPGFVIQGGDAVGPTPGFGGPGYEFADEPPTGEPPFYPRMSVVMANSGPDTNGSQFFIVTGPQGEALPAEFTRFGGITAGTPVVEEIEATGDPASQDGVPSELTVIEQITVAEL